MPIYGSGVLNDPKLKKMQRWLNRTYQHQMEQMSYDIFNNVFTLEMEPHDHAWAMRRILTKKPRAKGVA